MARFRQSGPINSDDLQTFFGQTSGSAQNTDQYYRGGGIVPATGPSGGVAAVHQIDVAEGASSDAPSTAEELFIYLTGVSGIDQDLVLNGETYISDPIRVNVSPSAWIADSSTTLFFRPTSGILTRAQLESIGFTGTDLDSLAGGSNTDFVLPNSQTVTYTITNTSRTGEKIYRGNNIRNRSDGTATGFEFISLTLGASDQTLNGELVSSTGSFQNNDIVNIEVVFSGGTFDRNNAVVELVDTTTDNILIEDVELGNDLLTDVALRDDFAAKLQALPEITNVFTITTGTLTDEIHQRIFVTNYYSGAVDSVITVYDNTTTGDDPYFRYVTDTTSIISEALESVNALPLPTTRPTTGRLYMGYRGGITEERAVQAFRGFYTANTPQALTDVSSLNRRLLVRTDNYDASYLIDQVSIGFRTTQLYVLSDGREFNEEERTLINAIPTTAEFPNVVTIVGEFEGAQVGDPVVFLTGSTVGHRDLSVSFTNNDGDISGSTFGILAEGRGDTTTSEIRLNFGMDVSPQIVDIILNQQDRQGLADIITRTIDSSHGQLYATSFTNASSIQDSHQRERSLPTVIVTTIGSSGLQDSDFTITQTQAGIPTTRQTGQTLIYTTGNTLDASNQWGFFTGVDAAATNTNPSAWPTTNIFLRINAGDFSSADLQTTLNLAREPDATNQVVDSTTIIISAGPTGGGGGTRFNQGVYNVVGIQTVSATNLDVTLTLEVGIPELLENDVPNDGDAVGLTIFRLPRGDINTDIPRDARTTDYPAIQYSLGDIAATTTGWNFHDAIDGAMTTLSTWPTTGEFFLHVGLSDIVLDDIEATLGLTEITQTMQDVTGATLVFSYLFLDLVNATSTSVSYTHLTLPTIYSV